MYKSPLTGEPSESSQAPQQENSNKVGFSTRRKTKCVIYSLFGGFFAFGAFIAPNPRQESSQTSAATANVLRPSIPLSHSTVKEIPISFWFTKTGRQRWAVWWTRTDEV